jgi:hypothetical protein
MRIGIDFDNTIVCYDDVFFKAACLQGLIPSDLARSKGAVRDYLRAIGKEDAWTELQGYVYGARMDLAHPFPGVADFFQMCSRRNIPVFIISHKTLYPYLGPQYNLHDAAKKWLSSQQFSDQPPAHFELTLSQKLSKIADLQCTHFIDDLPELLTEKDFPSHVQKVLFDSNDQYPCGSYLRVKTWKEIIERLVSS